MVHREVRDAQSGATLDTLHPQHEGVAVEQVNRLLQRVTDPEVEVHYVLDRSVRWATLESNDWDESLTTATKCKTTTNPVARAARAAGSLRCLRAAGHAGKELRMELGDEQ